MSANTMKKRVMVVDDDEAITDLLKQVIEREGYEVDVFVNGQTALDFLKETSNKKGELPCLIILDLMMPVMNGYLFRENQLKDPELAAIPVVICTAGAVLANQKIRDLLIKNVLKKPMELDALLAEINSSCCGQLPP